MRTFHRFLLRVFFGFWVASGEFILLLLSFKVTPPAWLFLVNALTMTAPISILGHLMERRINERP